MTTPFKPHDITTINYTLRWPYLENPSNTTFAGPVQYDICNCGSSKGKILTDLGHLYTRYRCGGPDVDFGSPNDDLWVLQAPLGHINLLRPAKSEEIARRREIHETADAAAYAGKTFLLLTGPCPRGRYQAWATWSFLTSLPRAAREQVESVTLLIQPYEEDCVNDQGGRAYLSLANYIVGQLPSFNTLYLNIWGEETRTGTREFGFVFKKKGVKVVISWDWWSDETEIYDNVDDFLNGLETGMVGRKPAWEASMNTEHAGGATEAGEVDSGDLREADDLNEQPQGTTLESPASSRRTSIYLGHTPIEATWEEVTAPIESPNDSFRDPESVSRDENSEDDWSDAILTPISPDRGESAKHDATWHAL